MTTSRVNRVELQFGTTLVENGVITPILSSMSGSTAADTALIVTPGGNVGLNVYEIAYPLYAVQSTSTDSESINYIIVSSQ
jgi:hypothetical protein